MHLLTLDFETFWSQTHSLRKMSPIEYVMHPETELISLAAKVDDKPTDVVFGETEIRKLLADCRIEDSLAIAHNMSNFDCMLVAWRLGLQPRMWGCTQAMARPLHGRTVGLSLDKLVRHYGIGVKDSTALINTRGKHLADFTPGEIEAMRVYNKADTDQCYQLFKLLRPHTSNVEMWIIDSNVRMLVDDQFELDTGMLQVALQRERAKKRKTLMRLAEALGIQQPVPADGEGPEPWSEEDLAQMVKDELMSAPKFSRLLQSLQVEVPMKLAPKQPDDGEPRYIPALAKTDEGFTALLEHDNEVVAMAAAARLEMKSTLLESRIQSFLATGAVRGGKLPIPTRYWGAHTGRDSGELYNALNLPRIDRDKDDRIVPKLTNALRLSLRAPKGKLVGAADLSGIELRTNHTLWKVERTMALWKANPTADIYKDTAARYYHVDISEIAKPQRQFGKVLELACGFQCGPAKFKDFARSQFGLIVSDAESRDGVYGWRELTPEIADNRTGGWARCQMALDFIEAGDHFEIDPWGMTHTEKDAVVLPDGNKLRYDNLRRVVDAKTGRAVWKYGDGRHTKFIYGGSMTENIVQALARIVLMDNVREFWKRTGLRPALRVYDEPVYLFDEACAQDLLDELLEIMRTPPRWWPELVVWSEGDLAVSYGLAK